MKCFLTVVLLGAAITLFASDEETFLGAIFNTPEDDTARLVYADWIEEHGDPARAQLIRVQVRSARLPKGTERTTLEAEATELLRVNEEKWLPTIKTIRRNGGTLTWQRGFPNELIVPAHRLPLQSDRDAIDAIPHLVQLTLASRGVDDAAVRNFSQLKILKRVRSLKLPALDIGQYQMLAPQIKTIPHLDLFEPTVSLLFVFTNPGLGALTLRSTGEPPELDRIPKTIRKNLHTLSIIREGNDAPAHDVLSLQPMETAEMFPKLRKLVVRDFPVHHLDPTWAAIRRLRSLSLSAMASADEALLLGGFQDSSHELVELSLGGRSDFSKANPKLQEQLMRNREAFLAHDCFRTVKLLSEI